MRAKVQTLAASPQQRANKALHPTAYSLRFGRSSRRSGFRRRVSLVVSLVRQLLLEPMAGNASKLAHPVLLRADRVRSNSTVLPLPCIVFQKDWRFINANAAQTQHSAKAALTSSFGKPRDAGEIQARLEPNSLQKPLNSNRSSGGGLLLPSLLQMLLRLVSSLQARLWRYSLQVFLAFILVACGRGSRIICVRDGVRLW